MSLSLYAQNTLKAIPDMGKTEFQKVKNPKKDAKGGVEIYTTDEISKLLVAALDRDIDLIPKLFSHASKVSDRMSSTLKWRNGSR